VIFVVKKDFKQQDKFIIMKKIFSSFLFFALLSPILNGQEIILKQNNKTGVYKSGQKIVVKTYLADQEGDSLHIKVFKNNNLLIQKTDILIGKDSLTVYDGSFTESCSIIVEVRSKTVTANTGMIVDPESLKPGSQCPKDFAGYWKNIKNSLNKLPFDIKRNGATGINVEYGYSCENVEINCLGPKPVRGYFAKPLNAGQASLPIVLLVHAAGVKGSWCRSEPQNALVYAKMGALCFDLNAHGMLNDQTESYYSDLENGELKSYWLQGITKKDQVYFRGMYLRLLRTIEFLTRQPEWDGRRILVIGESQGGGQALVAAGLDDRVSAVVAIVPAMCDWFGSLSGRMSGWPQPFESGSSKEEMLKALPYYDAANILKQSKAIIFTEIGLIDMTCPSTSVFAAINQADGQKIIYTVPYRPHHQPEGILAKTWQEEIYKPRELFISNYLK
jgi:cephalosporin-C deacetylase-like acetyl esterase